MSPNRLNASNQESHEQCHVMRYKKSKEGQRQRFYSQNYKLCMYIVSSNRNRKVHIIIKTKRYKIEGSLYLCISLHNGVGNSSLVASLSVIRTSSGTPQDSWLPLSALFFSFGDKKNSAGPGEGSGGLGDHLNLSVRQVLLPQHRRVDWNIVPMQKQPSDSKLGLSSSAASGTSEGLWQCRQS